jgi:drug/metabolite transporter (DMT)-like permease
MRRLLLLGFIWGWSFLFMKVAVDGMTPATVTWARVTLGATVLLVVARRQRLRLPYDRLMLRHFSVMAVLGTAVPFTLLAWGEQRISSALTSVLNASTPLFTAVFAALAGQERLRRVQVGGLAVGIVGVAVAAGLGSSDLEGSSLAGSLAAIGAGAGYGVTMVYARRHLADVPVLVSASGQLVVASIVMLPVALATTAAGDGLSLTPTRVLSIVLLGAVGTGVAFLIHYGNIATLGATKASLVTYLVPVVAVVVGILALDERFEWGLPVGGALALAGIALVTRRPPAEADESDPGASGAEADDDVEPGEPALVTAPAGLEPPAVDPGAPRPGR